MRRVLGLVGMLAALSCWVPAQAQAQDVELCASMQFEEPYPEWAAKLPQPEPTAATAEEVQIPSADGTLISAKIYLPTSREGQRLPTVLVMSPYHSLLGMYAKEEENLSTNWADCITPFLLQRGYAVVLGDMRGTHNSGGCFDFGGRGDQEDGYAVVQWIAGQEWSDGDVGMYGLSHVGMSQYAAAVTAPPALKAIIPGAPITSFYRYLFHNGVHYEINEASPAAYEYGAAGPPPQNVQDPNWLENVLGTVSPCGAVNVVKGMSTDGTMDDFWKERDYARMADRIRTPVFHTHGTLDENVKTDHMGAIWAALERNGVPRKMLLGPWVHTFPQVPNWPLHALRWYEHWLQGNDTGMMAEPLVEAIDQDGTSRFMDAFPPGPERVLEAGDGVLVNGAAPAGTASYTDVPGMRRPHVQSTDGVHVAYTSEPVSAPLRISGTPVLELVAAIDREDTNFAVHLMDVAGDEGATYITRGYLDAKLRRGLDAPEPVVPGVPERYTIDLHPREYVLPEGHQLRVIISSSDSCATWSNDPECSAGTGVVSDTTAATVTVSEGPGLTRLRVPTAPLDAVIRSAGSGPPAVTAPPVPPAAGKPPAAAGLTVRARRAGRRRLRVQGTAPAGARVRLSVLRGRRVVARRTVRVPASGRFAAVLRARGRGLRVRATAPAPDGGRLSAVSARVR